MQSSTLRSLTATALGLVLPAAAADGLHFTAADILAWESHAFQGETRYTPVTLDGRAAVHAVCTGGGASGLFYRQDIDLRKTPVVEWSWRVETTFGAIDETRKAGDDYPARLYLVDAHPLLPWRTRAINYVWASAMPPGRAWPNAYAPQVRMLAVRGGQDAGGGWRSERRHVPADFRRLYGSAPERISSVAIMTDCDDTGGRAEAWYGEIRFLPGQPP